MNKWIAILLVVAVAAFGVWKLNPLNTNKGGTTTDLALLKYVPADTIFYMGGQADQELVNFMSGYVLAPSSPSQDAMISKMISDFILMDGKLSELLKSITETYSDGYDGTYGSLTEAIGMDMAGEYAFYAHGIAPVVRLPLANLKKFNELVELMASKADTNYSTKTYGDLSVKSWALSPEEDIHLNLLIAATETSVVITIAADSDTEQVILERLGQAAVKDSLADSGEIKSLTKDYSFTKDMIMFVNIERIAAGILKPESNSFGKGILKYIPEEERSKFKAKVSAECADEYLSLVAAAPRFITGYTQLDIKNQTMLMNTRMLLEIKNTLVTGELSKIRGHIPNHALTTNDKILSIGTGIDIDAMTPALTALWTAFTSADFKCEALIEAQKNAASVNPIMLGMMTGMGQGVKGFGASLFDITWDPNAMLPSAVSAIASISSINPQGLIALTSMIPMLSSVDIATDGTPTKINLPILPPTIDINVAIKGQHLAVYSGAKGEAAAKALESEKLDANGIYTLGINYRELLNLSSLLDNGAFGQGAACLQQYEFLHTMNSYRMDFNVLFDVNSMGVDTRVKGSMDLPKSATSLSVEGKWKTEYLNDSCTWDAFGQETINSNGTGTSIGKDPTEQCEGYNVTYDWKKTGNKIISSSETQEKYRDSCDEEWLEQDYPESVCHIINNSGDSFQCYFDPGSDDATLIRYTRM